MKKFVSYILWICFFLGMQSCTKENLEGCFYGLRLRAVYPFEIDNEAIPNIQSMRAYVFNENEILCAISEVKGSCLSPDCTMDIQLEPGKYKIVVWGSSNADFQHSYSEGTNALESSSDWGYTEGVVIGKTTLSNLQLFLKGEGQDGTSFIPNSTDYDDLYYGLVGTRLQGTSEYVEKEVVIPEYKIVEETVELIRNTNLLKATLSGLKYKIADTKDADIYVSGKGHCYNWRNAFSETTDNVKFSPDPNDLSTDNSLSINIKLQRIKMEGDPLVFHIYDKKKGVAIYSLNLSESLLKARDAEGKYIYASQEDLDRLYIHTLEIKFSIDLEVAVFVNGWEIKNIHPVMP